MMDAKDGPELIAEFTLGRQERPIVMNYHYAIQLGAASTPPQTQRVYIELLDASFNATERKYWINWGVPNFCADIQVGGDFYIAAWGTSREGRWRTNGSLVEALRRRSKTSHPRGD